MPSAFSFQLLAVFPYTNRIKSVQCYKPVKRIALIITVIVSGIGLVNFWHKQFVWLKYMRNSSSTHEKAPHRQAGLCFLLGNGQ
jgi:hypothetical protein